MGELGLSPSGVSLIVTAFLASLAAGLATGVGALPIFFLKKISPAVENAMLGLAAGVMLAATFFSLIVPALEAAKEKSVHETLAVSIVIAGVLLGALAVWLIHEFVPHEHFITGREGIEKTALARIWLFVIAITIHNFPEGLAVGVGFGGGRIENGTAIAIGIG
ncbi:MAG: ZIP family metal transporter, partial [Rhodospirillales bacterium]